MEGGADAGWRVLDRRRIPTPDDQGADAVVRQLVAAGNEAMTRWPGVATVGLGVPGLYNPETGETRFLPNVGGEWGGVPVGETIGAALNLPVQLINDARAFGLAELRLGAGRGVESMVGFALGTGVGAVVAVGGRVHQGHDGTAGELGHQTIDPDGPSCGCGNYGCLEAFVRADRLAEACGTPTPKEAEERARAGDQRAIDGLARVGRYLGIGIGNAIVALTPDRVVIGGGVSAAFDLLLPSVWEELRKRVRVTALESVEIMPAQLGPWAGAIGAALHGAETA